jgi:hypothetical protein
VIDTGRTLASDIEQFESYGARSIKLGEGTGVCRIYTVYFDSPGEIGPHEAGFDQLFVVVDGAGWGAGSDGVRVSLRAGQAALFRSGEMHSKGSEQGMTAVMVQVGDLAEVASTSGA